MFCLLVVLAKLSLLAKWLARKTPLRKPNRGEGIVSRNPRPKSAHDFLGLLYCFIVLLCICVVSCPYVIYYPTVVARYSLFVLKVPLNPKQTNKQANIGTWPKYTCLSLWVKLNHVTTRGQLTADVVMTKSWPIASRNTPCSYISNIYYIADVYHATWLVDFVSRGMQHSDMLDTRCVWLVHVNIGRWFQVIQLWGSQISMITRSPTHHFHKLYRICYRHTFLNKF